MWGNLQRRHMMQQGMSPFDIAMMNGAQAGAGYNPQYAASPFEYTQMMGNRMTNRSINDATRYDQAFTNDPTGHHMAQAAVADANATRNNGFSPAQWSQMRLSNDGRGFGGSGTYGANPGGRGTGGGGVLGGSGGSDGGGNNVGQDGPGKQPGPPGYDLVGGNWLEHDRPTAFSPQSPQQGQGMKTQDWNGGGTQDQVHYGNYPEPSKPFGHGSFDMGQMNDEGPSLGMQGLKLQQAKLDPRQPDFQQGQPQSGDKSDFNTWLDPNDPAHQIKPPDPLMPNSSPEATGQYDQQHDAYNQQQHPEDYKSSGDFQNGSPLALQAQQSLYGMSPRIDPQSQSYQSSIFGDGGTGFHQQQQTHLPPAPWNMGDGYDQGQMGAMNPQLSGGGWQNDFLGGGFGGDE